MITGVGVGRRRRLSIAGGIGFLLVGIIGVLAVLGPGIAPHSPSELVGPPFGQPSRAFLLGTDLLGRDILSRVLNGGRILLVLGAITTLVAYTCGTIVGMFAGYTRGLGDAMAMRTMDAIIAVPALLLLLVLAAAMGPGPVMMVVGIAAVQVPYVARLVRTATLEISTRGYVEAAVARGERTSAILLREIRPGLSRVIVAAAVPSLTNSILALAALSFFGVGLQPPSPDWGSMINENRGGLQFQPWGVIAPGAAIAFLVIGVNLVAERFIRNRGPSL